MPKMDFASFGGIRPSQSLRLLRSPYGAVAHNLDLKTGFFTPMCAPKVVTAGLTGEKINLSEDFGGVEAREPTVFDEDVSCVPFNCPDGLGLEGELVFCNVGPDLSDCDGNPQDYHAENCFGPIDPDKSKIYNAGPPWLPSEAPGFDPVRASCPIGDLPSADDVLSAKDRDPPEPYEGPREPLCVKEVHYRGCDALDGTPAHELCVCVDNPVDAPVAIVVDRETAEIRDQDAMCPEAQSFVYTYVSDLGQETAPSLPTVVTEIPGAHADIALELPTAPDGVNCVKIYRSSVPLSATTDGRRGMELPRYYLVGIYETSELPVITVPSSTVGDLGNELCTEEVLPPPPMECVVMLESGHYAGFRNNRLYVSERFEPCNWPLKYRFQIDDRITAIVVNGNRLYVGTTGKPYVLGFGGISGDTDPDYMGDSVFDLRAYGNRHMPVYCKDAVAETPNGPVFASIEGLFSVGEQGVREITAGRICMPEWCKFIPKRLTYSGGFLYGTGNEFSWRMQMMATDSGFIFGDLVTIDLNPDAQVGGTDGRLWYSDETGVNIWEGDSDEYMVGRWRSPPLHTSSPVAWRFARIRSCFDEPVVFRLYNDKRMIFERVVNNEQPFTLPPCPKGYDYQVEIEACTVVESVEIATSKVSLGQSSQPAQATN